MQEETVERISTKNTDPNKWQIKLLPFMSKTLIILTIFFFLGSLFQLIYLNHTILNSPKIDIDQSLSLLIPKSDLPNKDILETARLKALILLEDGSLQNQYYQANLLLMSRVWITYIGFVTGMILSIVGCVFILGKLRESFSEVSAKVVGYDLAFKSASPGLILAVLGTALMITALLVNHTINSKYGATYIHDTNFGPTESDNIQPAVRSDASIFSNDSSSNKIHKHEK
jgi:hypothetical protein